MKRKILIGIGILVVLVIILKVTKHSSVIKPTTDNSAILLNTTDVLAVKSGSVSSVIGFTGDLSSLNQAVISSEVDAIALKVLVSEGQFVKKGQVMAILDSTDLAQAVSQQEAILSSVKAQFELDKNKLNRQQELYKQGFISKISYDELQTNYQASLENINQQQAGLLRAKKQLAETTIKAPFDGYIYQKSIDNGQLASKNGKLFAIASLDELQLKAAIPSDYINQIKTGQDVVFSVETKDKTYTAKVTRLNPVAETGTRSYFIYVNLDNRKYQLKAGQFVRGQVILSMLNNTQYLPNDAIRKDEKGNYFVLMIENNKVIRKDIKLLLSNRVTNISAIGGLKDGDTVLAGNVLTVKPGDTVKILS